MNTEIQEIRKKLQEAQDQLLKLEESSIIDIDKLFRNLQNVGQILFESGIYGNITMKIGSYRIALKINKDIHQIIANKLEKTVPEQYGTIALYTVGGVIRLEAE